MANYLVPMTLSDLLDRTVRLTGKIFRRSIIIAAIVMLPAGVILGFALREMFASFADMFHVLANDPGISDPFAIVSPLVYGLGEMFVAGLFWAFANCILQVTAIDLTDAEINLAERSWQGAFARSWREAFRLLAQGLLKFLICMGIFILVIALSVHNPVALLLLIPAGIFCIWLLVQWSLGPQAIVCEGHGPLHGLSRSNRLVAGSWWRVAGLLLIFGLLVEFVVALISTPLYGFSFLPMLMKFSTLHSYDKSETARMME
ncbi:MAG TPA: hypothetical protein VFJ29_05405, partial [Candidatus Kapabacteria bacterium]|nr:hypothetical protein [Candidatus Kapabacteria bacterium]